MTLIVSLDELFEREDGLLARDPRWERAELGVLCTALNGFPFNSKHFNNGKGFPVLRIRDLDAGTTTTYFDGKFPPEYVVENGDLLVGMDGKFRCREWRGGRAGLNQRVCKLIPDERFLNGKFLLYAINGYLKAIEEATSSQTVRHLSSLDILRIPLPLPPLNEQRRIVAKLEEVLGKVEACQERLERIPELLKLFRQSVLVAGASGRLTQDCRARIFPVNAQRLLDTIKRQRLEMCKSTREHDEITDKFAEIALDDVVDDKGWISLSAELFCDFITKGTTPEPSEILSKGDVPFLKVYNIVDNKLNFNYRPQFVSKKTNVGLLARSILFPGDVVMNIVGPPLGKVAVISSQFPEWNMNQALAVFRPVKAVSPHFLHMALVGGPGVNGIIAETRGIVGQSNISLRQCRSLFVSLPTVAEQRQILHRANELLALADHIEARFKVAQANVVRLTQSILAKAFRGELVPHDPNDETASVMLERIRAEKGADGKHLALGQVHPVTPRNRPGRGRTPRR